MGLIAKFLAMADPFSEKGARQIKGDPGGGASFNADYHQPPGIESVPVDGDFFSCMDGAGSGNQVACGFLDFNTEKSTNPGEIRIYARSNPGEIACSIKLGADGSIDIQSIKSGSKINLNGVEIDQNGNITAPGEVTAKSTTTSIKLSTHLHNTAMGPSAPPTIGS